MTIFEGMEIEEMLRLYSVLHGGSTSAEDNKRINEELQRSVHLVDPEYEIKDDLTAFEAFLLVTKDAFDDTSNIQGYSESVYAPWDYLAPLDDEDVDSSEEDCACHEFTKIDTNDTNETQDVLHEENVSTRRNI